ncbi:glutaredoxin family protein [uncultured Deinococcus sp.]|uniref:glutaredoxin family protein n=1 Tax=uncultured Deinococcus sp. TaxID=158789 RepID=UPI00259097C4|nr:glutaredoxin family protein [uncultured Deinococcus sp.]
MPEPGLRLYSRVGCHLCEQAEERLDRYGFEYERLEVSGDPERERLYGHDVPVLTDPAGRVLLRGVFGPGRLGELRLRLRRELAPGGAGDV